MIQKILDEEKDDKSSFLDMDGTVISHKQGRFWKAQKMLSVSCGSGELKFLLRQGGIYWRWKNFR